MDHDQIQDDQDTYDVEVDELPPCGTNDCLWPCSHHIHDSEYPSDDLEIDLQELSMPSEHVCRSCRTIRDILAVCSGSTSHASSASGQRHELSRLSVKFNGQAKVEQFRVYCTCHHEDKYEIRMENLTRS